MKNKAALGSDSSQWLADGVTHTLRYPTGIRMALLLGSLFFAIISILSANSDEAMIGPLCFGPFMLLCFVTFVGTGVTVTVTSDEIRWRRLRREKRMHWDEVGRLRNCDLWGTLELYHKDGSCSIKLDSQLQGYLLIVHFLLVKRPDLWNAGPCESVTFRRVLWPQLAFGAVTVFMGVMGIKGIMEGEITAGIFLLAFGCAVSALLLLQPQAVTFEGDDLVIKAVLRKQRLKASSIKELRMETTRTENVMVHPVVVELKNGKKVSLAGIREGSPKLFHSLVGWVQSNSTEATDERGTE